MFFFGVAELTNIPLTIIDVFKYLPALKQNYPNLNEFFRSSFAILFIILRLILWPIYCYEFWIHSLQLVVVGLNNNNTPNTIASAINTLLTILNVTPLASHIQCHSLFVVCFFLFANVLLTLLQFYWGVTIFGFLFVSNKKKEKDNKNIKKE